MDLTDLEILLTISKEKSMRKATKSLHLSQSAISKKVQSLEKELDIKIFQRSANGVTLTDDGRLFLQYANRALTTLKEGINQTKLQQLNQRVIKIGVATPLISLVDGISHYFLSKKITLEIVTSNSPTIMRNLHEGLFDYGLFGSHNKPKNLHAYPIHKQDFYLIGGERYFKEFHRFIGLTIPYIQMDLILLLQKLPLVLPKQGFNMRTIIDSMYEKYFGHKPNMVAEVDTEDLIRQFVQKNYGCAFVTQTTFNPSDNHDTYNSEQETFQVQVDKKRKLYRAPVNFLFPARHVYFAQAPNVRKEMITKVLETYKENYRGTSSWESV